MQHSPLVSIITPSYMQGDFIEACIESVKNQSYQHIEHIIFDAQSDDQTDEVVKSFLGSYPLKYFSESDHGQAHAINKGLDRAQGEIVCWLNSDDLYHDQHVIAKIVSLFNQHPAVDVITGGGVFITEEGKWMENIPVEPRAASLTYMRRTCLTLQPSTFWRKSDIRLDESLHYAFDWKFFLEMLLKKKKFMIIEDPLSQYRVHGLSKTHMDLAVRKKEILEVAHFAENNVFQVKWNQFIYRLFLISEKRNLPWVKRFANFSNRVAYNLSGGLINSC